MKVKATQARLCRKLIQVWLLGVAGIHETDDPGHAFVIIHVLILAEASASLHPVLAAILKAWPTSLRRFHRAASRQSTQSSEHRESCRRRKPACGRCACHKSVRAWDSR